MTHLVAFFLRRTYADAVILQERGRERRAWGIKASIELGRMRLTTYLMVELSYALVWGENWETFEQGGRDFQLIRFTVDFLFNAFYVYVYATS